VTTRLAPEPPVPRHAARHAQPFLISSPLPMMQKKAKEELAAAIAAPAMPPTGRTRTSVSLAPGAAGAGAGAAAGSAPGAAAGAMTGPGGESLSASEWELRQENALIAQRKVAKALTQMCANEMMLFHFVTKGGIEAINRLVRDSTDPEVN